MEEKLKYWSKRYKLKDLVICGHEYVLDVILEKLFG